MRVLILYRSCGPSYVARGWENALRSAGHEVAYWYPEQISTFDVFRQFKPDLFIGTTWNADEALLKVAKIYSQTRFVLYAGTWGKLADELDPATYPIVKCENQPFLERMKRETGRPDLVWLHVTPSYLEPVLGHYKSIGITPAGITNGADLLTFAGGTVKEEYRCDVAFVGGMWHYKGRLAYPYIGPLLHPQSGLHCKVWGNQTWAAPCYLGLLDESEAKHVFASARVCPSIGEPHSTIFSDIVERYYKIPVAGGLVVGGPEVAIDEEFGPGVIPCGSTPQQYEAIIRHYIDDKEERRRVMALQQQVMLRDHTYHDRLAQLFALLDQPHEREKILQAKQQIVTALIPL